MAKPKPMPRLLITIGLRSPISAAYRFWISRYSAQALLSDQLAVICIPQRGTGSVFLFGLDVGGLLGAVAMATCVLVPSHSMWTVNGRPMSPTSAGDSCLSERSI